jgi:hypothetical protein
MVESVILVHGYSVQTLDTYGLIPQRLAASNIATKQIYLSAYDSLNDDITCDDLALALDDQVQVLVTAGADLSNTAVIAHSTGAIVVRRWLLNRWAAGKPLPSHFVSLAGAHHGSTVAQLGETQLAYLFRAFDGTSVGLEVLQDLDYGSEFLLRLNEEWLDAFDAPRPPPIWIFSMIGDDHSAFRNQIFWQTHESGSDCTVRISGGNLNYRILSIDQNAANPSLTVKAPPATVPHLVLHGVSHTGDNGILGGNAATADVVYPHIQEALNVASAADYLKITDSWTQQTAQWSAAHTDDCNATIVFSLKHPGGRNIKDSLILIKDHSATQQSDTQAVLNVAASMEARQPTKNSAVPSSVSFYVNFAKFIASYPHTVEIHVNSGCEEITYPQVNYQVALDQIGSIRANEFAYVRVTMKRDPRGTYSILRLSENPSVSKKFPPMPV